MTAPESSRSQGVFETHIRKVWETTPEAVRYAVVDVLDQAEYVVEWFRDQKIKPEPLAVAQLTGLIMARMPPPEWSNRPLLSAAEGGNRPLLPPETDR